MVCELDWFLTVWIGKLLLLTESYPFLFLFVVVVVVVVIAFFRRRSGWR